MNRKRPAVVRAATGLAAGAVALLLAVQVSADDGIGPRGPVGPAGALGPAGGKAVPAPAERPAPARAPRAALPWTGEGNHLEASGNSAEAVRCGPAGASVNSVDVQGAQLQGRTVIVQERNSSGVDTRDCPPPAVGPAAPAGSTNSLRIR